jgi:hypothetical protein
MRQMTLDLDTRVLDGIAEAKTLAADGNTAAAQRVYRELLAELDDDPRQAVCVLHMYAIVVDDLHEKLAINEEALRRATALSEDVFPEAMRATLYANLGWSRLSLGDAAAAKDWYVRAQVAAEGLDDDDYGRMMRHGVKRQLELLADATH